MAANKIEQQISEIEQYIEECKYITFSSTKVAVDKEVIIGMLEDLKSSMPEEVALYRRVVTERERILGDAKKKAQALVDETTAQTNQMINEQEIMQQAYAHANEILRTASQQAQDIENNAVADAQNYRQMAVQYMDRMLAEIEAATMQAQDNANMIFSEYANNLQNFVSTIQSNRRELFPPEEPAQMTDSLGMTDDIQATESGIPEEGAGPVSQHTGMIGTGELNLDTVSH